MHDINMTLKPQSTDWLSANDQQIWFNKFKSQDVAGLKFNDFECFLEYALYYYCRSFNRKSDDDNQKDEDIAFTNQQEMQLFSRFDTRNDHIIDKEEFIRMCQDWLSKIYQPISALVIVDVQNDFIDGSLALINGPARQDGAEVVPIINDLVEHCLFDTIVYTQDWHPIDHIGFHANLPLRKYTIKNNNNNGQSDKESLVKSSESNSVGEINGKHDNKTASEEQNDDSNKFKLKRLTSKVQVFDTVLFDDGRMEQKLWPVHCVQNSWGAELHPKLKVAPDAVRIYKGTLTNVDAYSAFWDNMRLNETGLRQELKSRKINDVYVCGLALDYCVAASAIDSVNSGFMTFIIDDACRGIDNTEMEKRKDEMLSKGIVFISSKEVKNYLSNSEKSIGDRKNFQESSDDQSIQPSDNVVINENKMDRKLFMNICLKRALLTINQH